MSAASEEKSEAANSENQVKPANSVRSGVLVVDKPQGVTSHDVVAAVRHALRIKRVGHAGTLDPMATGILVIGFGSATRLLNYITGSSKTYKTTIRLGASTNTDDADGKITDRALCEDIAKITDELIYSAAEKLTGNIKQIPSAYSAVKINGKRAYESMRAGQSVELKPRDINVSSFEINSISRTESFIDVNAQISCSSGTYIRALGRDMGEALGIGGYLTMLRRTRVGGFEASDSACVKAQTREKTYVNRQGETVERKQAFFAHDANLSEHRISPAEAAKNVMPCVCVDEKSAKDLRFGRIAYADLQNTNNFAKKIAENNEKSCFAAVLEKGSNFEAAAGEPAENPAEHSSENPAENTADKRAENTAKSEAELIAIVKKCGKNKIKPVVVFPTENLKSEKREKPAAVQNRQMSKPVLKFSGRENSKPRESET